MSMPWEYTRAFHQRFKSVDDPRVEQAYDSLLYILSHVKSDQVAAAWLGVSRRTIGRWKNEGFGPDQIRAHYRDLSRVSGNIERRIQRELKKAGPGAVVETRAVIFQRPGSQPGEPGATHVYVAGQTLEQMWKHFLKYQSYFYDANIRDPVYSAFYLTIEFGSQYQGQFWDGEDTHKIKRPKGSGAFIDGGKTYNTALAPSCADLHPYDEPVRGGNNLVLRECFLEHFYKPNTTIKRIVFVMRKSSKNRD